MKLVRNSALFLGQNGYFKKICKKYFCIWGDLKSCLKQCNNKNRSAVSFAHRVVSMHAISMPLLMRINTTSKPGVLESIVKFIGTFGFFLKKTLGFSAHLRLAQF